MKVHIAGFEWRLGNIITLDDLFKHLGQKWGDEIPCGENNRIIYVADHEGYYSGLYITIKDHQTFCKMRALGGGNVRISMGAVDDEHRLLEFNMFVIRKDTQRGLYMHYRGSASLPHFHIFMRKQYAELRAAKIDDAMQRRDKAAARRLRTSPRSLGWGILTRPEDFRTLIAALERVKVFDFDAATFTPLEARYQPVQRYVAAERRRIRFAADIPSRLLADAIDVMRINEGITQARVYGEDEDGLERIIRLVNNPTSFGNFDFDTEVTPLMDFEATEYHLSELVDKLLDIAASARALFEFPEAASV